jgi:hypothetical protein
VRTKGLQTNAVCKLVDCGQALPQLFLNNFYIPFPLHTATTTTTTTFTTTTTTTTIRYRAPRKCQFIFWGYQHFSASESGHALKTSIQEDSKNAKNANLVRLEGAILKDTV